MEPSRISEQYIKKQRANYLAHARRHLYPMPWAAWQQGWDAAVRFLTKMEDVDTFCTHCGKPLMLEECNFIGEDVFCNKCFEQLNKGEL